MSVRSHVSCGCIGSRWSVFHAICRFRSKANVRDILQMQVYREKDKVCDKLVSSSSCRTLLCLHTVHAICLLNRGLGLRYTWRNATGTIISFPFHVQVDILYEPSQHEGAKDVFVKVFTGHPGGLRPILLVDGGCLKREAHQGWLGVLMTLGLCHWGCDM